MKERTLICPKCEGVKTKEFKMFLRDYLHSFRECDECHFTSALPISKSPEWQNLPLEGRTFYLDNWKSWECVYIPGSAFLNSKLEARKIFERNEMKRKQS